CMLHARPERRHALDGELGNAQDDALSFDELQLRLQPEASRINKLAAETPATYIIFDCLLDARGRSLLEAPLTERRRALEAFYAKVSNEPRLWLSPYTHDRAEAEAWLAKSGGALDVVDVK